MFTPETISEVIVKARNSVPPEGMTTKVIAIDGPGGAGKSVLAQQTAEKLRAPVVPTDDFASWDQPLNWWPRLLDEVLKPLAQDKAARYQRYDWASKRLAEWREIKPSEFLIIEGVSSSRKAFRPYLAMSVWVETPREERLRRGLERDGEEERSQWEEWMRQEDEYVARENPHENADLVVSGVAGIFPIPE